MYLSELLILNYRSCQKLHVRLESELPNIFIGINDCGKSTILQAVGLLLDGKPKFSYLTDEKKKDDISNTRLEVGEYTELFEQCQIPPVPGYSKKESLVAGRFILEGSDINSKNETNLSNHLLWVVEKTPDSSVWLARVFSEEMRKHTDFILTLDNQDGQPTELYKANNTTLNRHKKELNITDNEIENENKVGRFKNIELVRAIYTKCQLTPCWVEYKSDKGFWPEFRYLDWNITLEQLTQFANDAIKTKVDRQLVTAERFANRQATKAQKILNEEL
ncbi:MAG: AAA family ATPase, partial [Chloroflexota bacterium]